MTIKYIGNGKYTGLAADTKPTNAIINAELWETDAGKLWRYNGTTWRPEYIKNPASCIVFKQGTTYYAQESDGTILSSSTTDASVVINAAIAAIEGAASRGYGGKVFIFAGDYQCKTTITAFDETLGFDSVDLEGEGKGTRLHFTPASALTNGILWRVDHGRISSMYLFGNSNITNIVRLQGQTVGPSQNSYCILENLHIAGNDAPSGGSAVPIATQVGVLIDGSIPAVYFTKIVNVDLNCLGIGIDAFGNHGHATMQSNVMGINCNTIIKLRNGQHNLTNIWCQGTEVTGTYGIHCALDTPNADSGSQVIISNVNAEMQLTGAETAAVLIDKGVPNCKTVNIRNTEAIRRYQYAILDKNVRRVNYHLDSVFSSTGTANSGNSIGWWNCGNQSFGNEGGTFAGQIIENPPNSFNTQGTSNGPTKNISTAASLNAMASIYYNKNQGYGTSSGTSNWGRSNNPRFQCQFIPISTSNWRFFIGIWDQFTAPTSTSDILNGRKGFGLWYDSVVSPNYKIMHNDGTGASTVTQIGAGLAVSVDYVRIEIITDHANSTFTLNFVSDTHPWTSTTATTDIPDNTGNLGWLISVEALSAFAKTLWVYSIEQETFNG
jgi:hypothetical protein